MAANASMAVALPALESSSFGTGVGEPVALPALESSSFGAGVGEPPDKLRVTLHSAPRAIAIMFENSVLIISEYSTKILSFTKSHLETSQEFAMHRGASLKRILNAWLMPSIEQSAVISISPYPPDTMVPTNDRISCVRKRTEIRKYINQMGKDNDTEY